MAAALTAERLASYVTGVIATLVAIGGLYLVKHLQAGTAIAIITAGTIAIWLGRTSFRLVMLQGSGHGGSCIPVGFVELRSSWPVVLAALPPVLSLTCAAIGLWSVSLGLHIGQVLGVTGLVVAGILTGRRLEARGWARWSYVLWLALTGLSVAGIEALSRAI